MECRLLPGDCKLVDGESYCFVVQPVNAHSIAGARQRSDGVRICGPPTAGVVIETSSPVPHQSTYWGVHALTQHAHVSDDDESTANVDRDYAYNNELHVRWYGFQDDCAYGIDKYDVTLLRFDVGAHGFAQRGPALQRVL